MAANTGWRPVPALGCASLGVGGLALVALGFGEGIAFSVLGRRPLAGLGELWWRLLGWGAWPCALLLALAGVGLLARADELPWRLPWGRALAVETLLAALLTLIGLARGAATAADAGPEGQLGWALAAVSREALGSTSAFLLWLAAALLGGLSTLRIGGARLAAGLEALADALAMEVPPPPDPDTLAPPSRPVVRASAQPPASAAQSATVGALRHRGQAPMPPAESGIDRETTSAGPAPAPTLPGPRDPAADDARRRPPPVRDASRPSGAKPRAGRRSTLLPGLDLFDPAPAGEARVEDGALQAVGRRIEETLAGFGVPVQVVEIERGPTFTRFGLRPGYVMRGDQRLRVKVSRITALQQDLALALAAPTVRIEAPVPGRPIVGIEVPNPDSTAVGLRAMLEDPAFRRVARAGGLALAMGREVTGETVVADLARMPHLLVAGATGSGKSVFLNVLLASLLFQHTPDDLRLILIDPKRVELGRFGTLPHLIAGVVTDPAEAVGALRWLVAEMERRYQVFSERGARDRAGFNAQSPAGEAPLPALVVVIDELADLMMTAPEEVEPLLTRLAQMGRATGIHLVVATQRPSTDVVTGLIKANFPARAAFAVSSGIDSRVILDQMGAESLLGRGDMLFQPPDRPHARRLQGALVADAELDRLIDFWRGSHWDAPRRLPPWEDLVPSGDPDAELLDQARAIAQEGRELSASLLQRRLRIGYSRARKLYDRLSEEGLVAGSRDSEGFDWVDDEFDR
ncbi:MAG: DUF87 domain-containing protein [Caldilineae bacterium]|nr:DUF87 domain-containing protein [Caldilineae bacterium]